MAWAALLLLSLVLTFGEARLVLTRLVTALAGDVLGQDAAVLRLGLTGASIGSLAGLFLLLRDVLLRLLFGPVQRRLHQPQGKARLVLTPLLIVLAGDVLGQDAAVLRQGLTGAGIGSPAGLLRLLRVRAPGGL